VCTAIVRPREVLPFTLSVLPSNCLQSPSHLVLRNVGSDSHKARVCGLSLAGITGSISSRGHGCLSVGVCVLSSRGLWHGLVARPESYPLLFECDREASQRGDSGSVGAVTPRNMPVGGPGAEEPERRHPPGFCTPCF